MQGSGPARRQGRGASMEKWKRRIGMKVASSFSKWYLKMILDSEEGPKIKK
jgi:hypothetical protein